MVRKIFLFLVLILTTFVVKAQNLDSLWDMSLEELQNLQVSGASRYNQKVSDVPNSIQVITHQQIVDRGYQDLSDVLKDVSGLDIIDNAGQFGEFYSFRGIEGNDRFLVLVNGHKINPASGTQLSVGNSISVRYADRIEIIYGPASAAYGADAFSGIVNIIYNETPQANNFNFAGNFNYGSLNTYDGSFQSSLKVNKDLSFFLMSRVYTSDGPSYIDDTANYDYDLIRTYPSPLVSQFQQPTNDHTVYFNATYKKFSVNYFRQSFDEGNALGFIPEIYIYNKENKWKTSTDMLWLSYSSTSRKTGGTLTADVTLKRHLQDNNTIYYKWNVPLAFDADETYKQYMTGDDKTIKGIVTYNQKLSNKFEFIAGVENEYTTSIPPYANDQVLGQSFKYEGFSAQMISDALTIEENRTAGFGQFVFSHKIINLTLGARYDYSTRYGGVFNPRLGFILSPTKSTKIKFNYGKAFQAPSLFYQYEQWGAPTIVNVSMAEIQNTNPSWKLENQIVNTFDFNISQSISENVQIRTSAYLSKLTNLIERNLFSDSTYNKYFDSYTPGLRNENIGTQHIAGADALFEAKITGNVIFNSYYSFIKAYSVSSENVHTLLPRISEHKVWVGLTVQNLFKYVTFSARFKWVSDMYNANTAVYATNTQPGFYNLDANISLNNISKYFNIYANFTNVLNQHYLNGGLYEQTGVYTATIPQNGFMFKVGAQFFIN